MKKFLLVTLLPLAAFADPFGEKRHITVQGFCTRQIAPDRGSIVVTAEATEPDLQSASKKATDTYEKLRDSVQKMRLENANLITSEYSLQEVREWQKDRQVSKGFRARMGLRVTTSSIQRLGEIISVAAKLGLREVGNLDTFLSQEKLLKEQMACFEEAGSNATKRAETLAGSLGAKIGEVLEISELREDTGGPVRPMAMTMNAKSSRMEMADAGGAPSGVEAGSRTMSMTVYATFALK